jgi:hypothetical protein
VRAVPGLAGHAQPAAGSMSSTPGRPPTRSDLRNLVKGQKATPWRRWDLVGTRKSARTAKYIAERRAAGDAPRPLTDLDDAV